MRILTVIIALAIALPAAGQTVLRDPTRPPSAAEVAAWFDQGAQTRASTPFHLQSILLSSQRRIAIIDGQRLQAGDTIEGAEVQRIEPGRVVLERDGQAIELTIDTHLPHHPDESRN